MSEEDDVKNFESALRDVFQRFKADEDAIRADHARAVTAGELPEGAGIERRPLSEKATRRFLVDPMLRALGWDPEDSYAVTEEARLGGTEGGGRFRPDYLMDDQDKLPVMLVEAKGADAKGVRFPRGPEAVGQAGANLISEALLHASVNGAEEQGHKIVAQWRGWLETLRNYTSALDSSEFRTLQRVVITSGQWMAIFTNPTAAFIDGAGPTADEVKYYASPEEMVEYHDEIYGLLARQRLTGEDLSPFE